MSPEDEYYYPDIKVQSVENDYFPHQNRQATTFKHGESKSRMHS